jgi:hypothetical protein
VRAVECVYEVRGWEWEVKGLKVRELGDKRMGGKTLGVTRGEKMRGVGGVRWEARRL